MAVMLPKQDKSHAFLGLDEDVSEYLIVNVAVQLFQFKSFLIPSLFPILVF